MKLIVAGTRDFTNRDFIRHHMNRIWREVGPYEVVSGDARGVDRVAADIAKQAGIRLYLRPAEWDRYGKSAGYRRNAEMARFADGLIAFWDFESKGTGHMIDLAGEHKLQYCWTIDTRTSKEGT